jgi:two-component system chemotaxis response regulator CheY
MTDTNDPNEKTVLIVDDVDYSRQLLRNAILAVCDQNKLSTKHFKIVNAANGMGALQKISETSPDLIFLDIELPDANGIELLKTIKADYPRTVVIMVSGQSTVNNVKAALISGASGFIVKPFSADKVLEALKSFERKMK